MDAFVHPTSVYPDATRSSAAALTIPLHRPDRGRRSLVVAAGVVLIFMVLEIVGGFFANSLAIMTDAAHLLTDVMGFGISWIAITLAMRAPTVSFSFGFHRAEILGALLSVFLIWMVSAFLLHTSPQRLAALATTLMSILVANVLFFGQGDGSLGNTISIGVVSALVVAPVGAVLPQFFASSPRNR